jgi:hypothetical protein
MPNDFLGNSNMNSLKDCWLILSKMENSELIGLQLTKSERWKVRAH